MSAGLQGMASELRFTKDGVPIFDGAPELFVSYQRAALNYCETVEWKKRGLVGPRLQAALEGSAKLAVEHMAPGWVSHEKGASQLLAYLKKQVRALTLAEAGRTMSRFFYGIKRRKGEGMAAWIVRHDEALLEAKRTLAEAIHEYGPKKLKVPTATATSWRPGPRSRPPSGASEVGTAPEVEDGASTGQGGVEGNDIDVPEEESTGEHDEVMAWEDPWWTWSTWSSWQWRGSDSGSWAWDKWSQPDSQGRASWDASEAASVAWLLLQRSGLEASDRSVVVANLKNRFTTERVKEALKLTWPDEELRRHDASRPSALFSVDEAAMMADDADMEPGETPEWDDPEDHYAYQALEDEAQEAYAALHDARRTLRDAREKQAMMRRNRHFYPGKGSGKHRSSPPDRPPPKCFKCGGPHFRRDCPQQGAATNQDQGVHLVFIAKEENAALNSPEGAAEPEWHEEAALTAEHLEQSAHVTLEQAIQEGKAIIDGGATSSLGSEEAIQQIANLNWQRAGEDGIEIIPDEQPSFRFGNNGRHACMATALLKLPLGAKHGKMKIHLHDIPKQPVLLSVKGLRSLGAVIDFERNEAIFKNVDASRIVSLETTESGHQLFPLTEDVLQDSRARKTPFRTFGEDSEAPSSAPAVE